MTNDPLAAARGVLVGIGLGLLFWTVVGVCYWLATGVNV